MKCIEVQRALADMDSLPFKGEKGFFNLVIKHVVHCATCEKVWREKVDELLHKEGVEIRDGTILPIDS